MKIRCKSCKKTFAPPGRGRRPKFCSAACRQKAYRKRGTAPRRFPMALLRSDLYKIRDQTARGQAAVKVLEELGYEVVLKPRPSLPSKAKPQLSVVGDDDNTKS